jgi:hypothetical protein
MDVVASVEHNSRTSNFIIAIAGAVGTVVLWWVHLAHPGIFPDPVYDGGHSNFPRFAVGLTPPFLMVFALAHAAFPRPAAINTFGPMSSYLKQQASARLWKISMIAAVVAALNFLFMVFSSIPPHN